MNTSYQELIDRIRYMTTQDKKTKTQRALKLAEEAGEVAASVLSETQAPGCEYKKLNKVDVLEECSDVIIVALSLISDYGFTDSEITTTIENKLQKWQNKIRG